MAGRNKIRLTLGALLLAVAVAALAFEHWQAQTIQLPSIENGTAGPLSVQKAQLIADFAGALADSENDSREFALQELRIWKDDLLKRTRENLQTGIWGYVDGRRMDIEWAFRWIRSRENADDVFRTEMGEKIVAAMGGSELLGKEVEDIAEKATRFYVVRLADRFASIQLAYKERNIDTAPFLESLRFQVSSAAGKERRYLSWDELVAGGAIFWGVKTAFEVVGKRSLSQASIRTITMSLGGHAQLCGTPAMMTKCQHAANHGLRYLKVGLKGVGVAPAAAASWAVPVAAAVTVAWLIYEDSKAFAEAKEQLISGALASSLQQQIHGLVKPDGAIGATLRQATATLSSSFEERSRVSVIERLFSL